MPAMLHLFATDPDLISHRLESLRDDPLFLQRVPPCPRDKIAGLKWLVAYCGMNDKIYRDEAGVAVELSKRPFSTPYPDASPAAEVFARTGSEGKCFSTHEEATLKTENAD